MKRLSLCLVITLALGLATLAFAHHKPGHGCPPGHGGTPPGHGGTPPGQGGPPCPDDPGGGGNPGFPPPIDLVCGLVGSVVEATWEAVTGAGRYHVSVDVTALDGTVLQLGYDTTDTFIIIPVIDLDLDVLDLAGVQLKVRAMKAQGAKGSNKGTFSDWCVVF